MCGVTGIYCDTNIPQKCELEAMVHSLRRRGPDDRGYFLSGPLGLGMCRLSIVDPLNGRQPLCNEDGNVVVVCNGEIYNHPELRVELEKKGHRYRTRSDTETIAHLYEEEDLNFLECLQGMFGLALWDQKRRRLIIARDRLGIKPVFYAKDSKCLLFGSEIKAILASKRSNFSIDESAVDAYFKLGYVPNPLTIYREIKKLPPAHALIFENGETRLWRYWNLSFEPKLIKKDSEWTEEFLSLFQETVRKHLMSDVPLGAFLSGGVDSSFVVAALASVTDTPLQTFTVGFTGSVGGYLDERTIAKEVSDRYGTQHTEFEVKPQPEDIIDEVVEAFDEPFADDSVIPTYYLCRETSKKVKVAFSGLGGDELFAGYERYLGLLLSTYLDKIPDVIKGSIIGPLVDRLPELKNGHYTINHLKRLFRGTKYPPAERYQRYISIFQNDERHSLLPNLNDPSKEDDDLRFFSNSSTVLLDQALCQDINTYLPEDILALSDRLSMWHSLELRVPFVDHKLVEFCAAMPADLKVRGREKKYLLRRAARERVPNSVLNHRKQGFAAPMAAWLRGDLRDYISDTLSASSIAGRSILNAGYVQTLLQDHWDRRELNDRKIFSVLMFQRWLDKAKTN